MFQILAMIGILNVPQIGIGFAVLARWPPALWIGTILALFHLAFGSVCLLTAFLTFGGLLEDPNIRWLVFCLLIIPACITLLAYVVALIAQRLPSRHSLELPENDHTQGGHPVRQPRRAIRPALPERLKPGTAGTVEPVASADGGRIPALRNLPSR